MKFIRKHGRVIPIREKGESKEKFESRLTKQDAASGAFVGLMSGHFKKRKGVVALMRLASVMQGATTTIARVREHGVAKGLWEDFKSSMLKTGAGAIGGAVGGMSLSATHIASPSIRKVSKATGRSISSASEKASSILKKFIKKKKTTVLDKRQIS